MRKPDVIRTLVALVSGDLFKRPTWKPGKPLVRDERDHGPNRLLSEEAKKAGVTIPQGDNPARRGPWRL